MHGQDLKEEHDRWRALAVEIDRYILLASPSSRRTQTSSLTGIEGIELQSFDANLLRVQWYLLEGRSLDFVALPRGRHIVFKPESSSNLGTRNQVSILPLVVPPETNYSQCSHKLGFRRSGGFCGDGYVISSNFDHRQCGMCFDGDQIVESFRIVWISSLLLHYVMCQIAILDNFSD